MLTTSILSMRRAGLVSEPVNVAHIAGGDYDCDCAHHEQHEHGHDDAGVEGDDQDSGHEVQGDEHHQEVLQEP